MRDMDTIYADCTEDCERMPECAVCGRRKPPVGRSVPLGATYCEHECPGHYMEPDAGHLWPGELTLIREEREARIDR